MMLKHDNFGFRVSGYGLKLLLLSILLLIALNLNANLILTTRLSAQYDSNVYSLSENDLNRFKDNIAFDYIETADDFKQKIDFRLSSEIIINQIRFTPFIQPSFTNFIQNSDKNTWSLLTGLNTQKDKLSLNFAYGYYPENYLRKYIDTDGTGENEKFEYQKMLWRFSSSYRYSNYIFPLFYGKYEYYHHNQYFTEYDGPAVTIGLGNRFITKYVNADLMYYFRAYNCESDNKEIQELIDKVKDGSYESNIYEIKLRTKRIYHSLADYRFFVNYSYEKRYFQSQIPLAIDLYHTGRIDNISTFSLGTNLWLTKNLNLTLDFLYRTRKVSSDHPPVITAKDNSKYQINSTIEWKLNILQ